MNGTADEGFDGTHKYVARRTGILRWKEVDEGWAGYSEITGQTFVIDAITRFVFDMIDERPDGILVSELTRRIQQELAAPSPAEVRMRTEQALGLLSTHDLVENKPFESS